MDLRIQEPCKSDWDLTELQAAYQQCVDVLRDEQQDAHWVGQLSTSALSTATAVSAMQQCLNSASSSVQQLAQLEEAIQAGNDWLAKHQNKDGGFGDTDRSHSNIATTLLVLSAWKMSGFHVPQQTKAAEEYVEAQGSWDGLRKRYGRDKTFVVPILSNCALAGLVSWKQVPALPFEAAWLPQEYYRFAQMPVVSYAVPALVAIGQAKFHFAPPANPLIAALRRRAVEPTLRVLRKMQPGSGGYLEAVPLTSFVLMSLAAIGKGDTPVAREALRFILESRLADGSWPIDTNLATWVTSLSMNALANRNDSIALPRIHSHGPTSPTSDLKEPEQSLVSARTVRWLLSCQHVRRHPFTGAEPYGWGWTDLSGAVPDSDDTPGALLALSQLDFGDSENHALDRLEDQVQLAASRGLRWLSRLQNRDGGWPTFCRGWGRLPFDRSGTDLTAHAIRAIAAWLPRLRATEANRETAYLSRLDKQVERGFRFLRKTQREDGSWLPLWFGNQDASDEENPVYGTSKVLLAYASKDQFSTAPAQKGLEYLVASQNEDGGWGGGFSTSYRIRSHTPADITAPKGSTIEESALALEALLTSGGEKRLQASIMRGLEWLCEALRQQHHKTAWPIGFYFAKLWYYEKLYPIIFSLGAIGKALAVFENTESSLQRISSD